MELRPQDRSEKYLIWSKVADEVKRNGAKAIIAISEAWLGKQDPKFPDPPAGESPDQNEALHLCAASADGVEFSYICHFKRIDGSIVFGETDIIEDKKASLFLEPIRKAWGISEKPRIIINKYKIGRNYPCPCRSGKKYKNCCASSFDKNLSENGLALYKNRSFSEAEEAFRHDLTQYIIWYYEHTIPYLLHDPLNADQILLMDIEAITAIVYFIANCLHYQNKTQKIDAFLRKSSDIIDDSRYKSNIESLRKYWLQSEHPEILENPY